MTKTTHQNLQLWETTFDFAVPHQDRRFAIEEQPDTETSGRVLSIQRHDVYSLDSRGGESEEEFRRSPRRPVQPASGVTRASFPRSKPVLRIQPRAYHRH